MNFEIMTGDNRETLKTLADASVDAIITDPPYGIDFLGKTWDANTGALETYTECLRVLKPGGYILAFSAARTYHHLAITLEQAGFEIRDQLMWLYASGFPKAQDIGKAIQKRIGVEETKEKKLNQYGGIANQTEREGGLNYKDNKQRETIIQEVIPTSPEAQQWSGWKTALKPAHEPICLARKPFKGSTIDNVLEHGVGALNIDATRIGYEDQADIDEYLNNKRGPMERGKGVEGEQIGMFDTGTGFKQIKREVTPEQDLPVGRFPSNVMGEVEGYQKYFYCPKVSRRERHTGFEQKYIPTNPQGMWDDGVQFQERKQGYTQDGTLGRMKDAMHKSDDNKILKNWEMVKAMGGHYITADGDPILEDGDFGNQADIPGYGWINLNGIKSVYEDWCKKNNVAANHGNNHPTVKPVALMRYLIKLVTPANSTVLDPFSGSGSTGMAAVELGHRFIGCELDPNYVAIAERRITAWNTPEDSGTTFEQLFE